jgi:nucleotide-binding universal stress UspA family protein
MHRRRALRPRLPTGPAAERILILGGKVMPINRILVPYDGSKFSEQALSVAVPLARQHGAAITMVQVSQLPPRLRRGDLAPESDGVTAVDIRATMRQQLDRVATRVARKSGLAIERDFREGEAILPELLRAVADHKADLIVMATHGRGGLSRVWMGSVADALLRELPVPVVLVRKARPYGAVATDEPTFPRVMVALDGSAAAERALAVALELLGDAPVHLMLARVDVVPSSTLSENWKPQAIRHLTESYLEPLAAQYRTATRQVTTHVEIENDVARALLKLATAERAFLLVIATHGHSGARRLMLGSVADKVVRGVETTPVLVVPRAAEG